MTIDIKMRRNGTKTFITADSKKGAIWLIEHMVLPNAVSLVVESEYSEELANTFKDAGLEVEGP